MKQKKGSQAAFEYLMVYGIVILIIVVAMVLLYSFSSSPGNIVVNTCQFSGGPTCLESVIGINSVTSNTALVLFLANSQTYPITGPNAIARIGSVNSSTAVCQPNYVKPGGVILCIINLTPKATLNQLLSGKVYLSAYNCATTTSPDCIGAVKESYLGYFAGHTQYINAYKAHITLTAAANSIPPNGQKDELVAHVQFLGYSIGEATVNFTADNSIPILGGQICGSKSPPRTCSSFSNSDRNGTAESNIWSYGNVLVTVYANFSGATANMLIAFGNVVDARTGSCSISGPINTYILTPANNSYPENPINPTGTLETYVVKKLIPQTLQINENGGTLLSCFSIDTSVGGGEVDENINGNSDNSIFNMAGNANVVTYINGGSDTLSINDNTGSGAISASANGNNNKLQISGGTGNMVLTLNGNGGSLSNITTAGQKVTLYLNGQHEAVNLTTTAVGANVIFNYINGGYETTNVLVADSTSIINVLAVNGNNNAFTSTNGNVMISTINGGPNTFNFVNEKVYIGSCPGSNNKITLTNSQYISGSPIHPSSGGSC